MNTYYRTVFFIFFIPLCGALHAFDDSSSSSSSSDESYCNDGTYCKLEESEAASSRGAEEAPLSFSSFKNLKMTIEDGFLRNDIPTIAVVYLMSRHRQNECTFGATVSGIVTTGCIAAAPFCFGLTMIAGVPYAGCCGLAAREAHRYKGLKRKAKRYLQINVSPEMYQMIIGFGASTKNFIFFLEEKGFDITRILSLYY